MVLPKELVPLLVDQTLVCEFASIKRDGTPITTPVAILPGNDGQTIDLSTGLGSPAKAERARRNPRVTLLYAEPRASLVENPPIILVYGHATVSDADLQSNLDRYIRALHVRAPSFARMPPFLLRWLRGGMARILLLVTPLKIVWWPAADLGKPPQQWQAPAGIQAPPSDPPPKSLITPHKPIATPVSNWREAVTRALKQWGPPTLTVVDKEGYPLPFKVLGWRCILTGYKLSYR